MQINLLYADPTLLICIKPVGILSQSDGKEDLSALLRAQEGLSFVQPAHRLDREAGGIVALAPTSAAAAVLSRSLAKGEWKKTYLAILKGEPESPTGELRDLLFHDANRNKAFVVTRYRKGVRSAVLRYRTLAQQKGLTLLAVELQTGRTHQIRVQFSSRGTPLLGDGRYGGGTGQLALWSTRLVLPHPQTRKPMTFFAPPPEEGPWHFFRDEITNLSERDLII